MASNAVDDYFNALPSGGTASAPRAKPKTDADAVFDMLPTALSSPKSPGEMPVSFKPGPGFTAGAPLPMVHGAVKGHGDPEAGHTEPSVKPGPVTSKFEAAGYGAAAGISGDYDDELSGVVGLVDPAAPKDYVDQSRDAETPDLRSFKQHVMDKYAEKRDDARGLKSTAAAEHPFAYGTAHLVGTAAQQAALAAGTGGMSLTPAGLGATGALTAVGNTDAPLTDEATWDAAKAGGALGAATGGLAKYAPVATGIAAGVGGLGLGAFGGKLGMSDAQRVEAGEGGLLSLGGAAAAGVSRAVANKAGKGADSARSLVTEFVDSKRAKALAAMEAESRGEGQGIDSIKSSPLMGKIKSFDAASAAEESPKTTATVTVRGKSTEMEPDTFIQGKAKDLAAKEKPYFDAEAKAGKAKAKRFAETLDEKETARAEERKAETDASVRQGKDDWAERLRESAAMSKQQARAGGAVEAGPEGTDPHAAAMSQLGHKSKEFYGGIRTQLGLGKPLTPEMEQGLTVLHPDFEGRLNDLAGEFKGGKAALMDKLLAEVEAKGTGRGTARPGYEPDTVIKPAAQPDTVVKSRANEFAGAAVLKDRPGDIATTTADMEVPFMKHPHPSIQEDFPEAYAFKNQSAEAHNRALNKMLGLEKTQDGETLNFSDLLSDKERLGIADAVGVNPRADAPKNPGAPTRNAREVAAWKAWTKNPDGPSTLVSSPKDEPGTLPIPGKSDQVGKTRTFPPSFFEGPIPETDFVDSPISNADWKKVAGAHVTDADLSHDQKALGKFAPGKLPVDLGEGRSADLSYWDRQPFTDSTAGLPDEAPPTQPPGGFPSQTEERVQGLIDSSPNRSTAGYLAKRALSGGLSKLGPKGMALSGAMFDSAKMDPATSAKLLSSLQQAANVIPNFQQKYGGLMAAATSPDDLLMRIKFIQDQEPDFKLDVSTPALTSGSGPSARR